MPRAKDKREAVVIEQEIFQRVAAAKIRLRFDKVVLRIRGDLKTALEDKVPAGQALLFTLTAPIKLPGKTRDAMLELIRGDFAAGEINGNQLRISRLTGLPPQRPKVLLFVHNPDVDGGTVLDIAEARLREKA